MSLALLATRTSRPIPHHMEGMPCRHTHRSASHTYLTLWKSQKIDYLQEMHQAGMHMHRSPRLLEQILRLEAAMNIRGLVPFVHAMPASSKVVLQLADAIDQDFKAHQTRFFRPLRCRDRTFSIPWEKVIKMVSTTGERRPQPHLLSVSYALTSGIKHLESAASWGFVNHFGNQQNAEMKRRFDDLLATQDGVDPQAKSYFSKKAWRLIRRYGRLQVGNFFVLGVPKEKLSRVAYDSLPYNVPTGRDIHSVGKEPAKHLSTLLAEKTHMATLLLFDETLDERSGILIVDANDETLVEAFCKDLDLTPMRDVAAYQEMLPTEESTFEIEQTQTRKALDRELEELIEQFAKVRIGEAVEISADHFDEDYQIADFPVCEF